MAKVSYAKGRTINTGNYNSTRIDVMHEVECEEHEVEEKYEQCKAFVHRKLQEAEQDV